MTTYPCTDCELNAPHHLAITAALTDGGLDEVTRDRMVAAALEAAPFTNDPVRTPSRSHGLLVAVGMAAVTVAAAVWWLQTQGDDSPAWTSIAQEREANRRFLSLPGTQTRLAKIDRDAYVAIAGGGTLDSDQDLSALLARIDQRHPHARHRFVFQATTQGDARYSARSGKPPFLSGELLNRMRIGMTGTGDGRHQFFRLAEGQELARRMEIPATRRMITPKLALPLRIGPPGSGVAVRVEAAYRPSYNAPIVLDDGIAMPRFEIPGSAELLTGTGTHRYRRYLVVVSVPELDIRFEPAEALGRPLTSEKDKGDLQLAGCTFRWFTEPATRRARNGNRPVLILERPSWLHRFPADPFSHAEDARSRLSGYELFWRDNTRKEHDAQLRAPTTARARIQLLTPSSPTRLIEILPTTKREDIWKALGWTR